MDFKEYQKQAPATAVPHHDPVMQKTIWVLGISGEAGEIVEKWKKIVAYDDAELPEDRRAELAKEIGDVLWYLTMFADSLGLSMQEIAEANIAKLQSRLERNQLKGRGDNR